MSDKRPDSVMDGLEPIDVYVHSLKDPHRTRTSTLSLVESDARFSGQSNCCSA